MYDIIIIGGGLAGLVSSIELARAGKRVLLIEKKTYPFHKVCGEYISNEVKPYLISLGLDFDKLQTTDIQRFQFTSPSGRVLETELDLGGFGVSRYRLDFELYQLAKSIGVEFLLGKTVSDYKNNIVYLEQNQEKKETFQAQYIIGSYGKRAKLDATLERGFFKKRSPYIGVKYHIQTDFPKDLIALHNFEDGYCGISAIEDDRYCLCYLTTRENLRKHGNIAEMEKNILWKNPHLKKIFTESKFLYDKPEVINEISFAPKNAIENHLLMVGDAAGLITPLCGNGMAMAIHGAKILTELILQDLPQAELEKRYQKTWNKHFKNRLWVGRTVQKLFGDVWMSEIALSVLGAFKPLLRLIIKSTHGEVIS